MINIWQLGITNLHMRQLFLTLSLIVTMFEHFFWPINTVLNGVNTYTCPNEHQLTNVQHQKSNMSFWFTPRDTLKIRGYSCFQTEPTTKVFATWFVPVLVFIHFHLGIYTLNLQTYETSCQDHYHRKCWQDFSFPFKMVD